jgi:hypothetical protein
VTLFTALLLQFLSIGTSPVLVILGLALAVLARGPGMVRLGVSGAGVLLGLVDAMEGVTLVDQGAILAVSGAAGLVVAEFVLHAVLPIILYVIGAALAAIGWIRGGPSR